MAVDLFSATRTKSKDQSPLIFRVRRKRTVFRIYLVSQRPPPLLWALPTPKTRYLFISKRCSGLFLEFSFKIFFLKERQISFLKEHFSPSIFTKKKIIFRGKAFERFPKRFVVNTLAPLYSTGETVSQQTNTNKYKHKNKHKRALRRTSRRSSGASSKSACSPQSRSSRY